MLKNSRSLRNLRERVEEKAARAPCVNCAGALRPRSVMTASPCWAAAGSRTRRTFGARRSEALGAGALSPGRCVGTPAQIARAPEAARSATSAVCVETFPGLGGHSGPERWSLFLG